MNHDSEPLTADPQAMRHWLAPRFEAPGLVSLCSKNNWTGIQTDDLDHAINWAMDEDRAGAEGIYRRVTTVTSRLPARSRGNARDSHALTGLWSDIDFDNDLHKATNLPANAEEARDIPRFAQLPEPTRVEHSGAGLYAWWEFNRPLIIGEDISFDEASQLAEDWQNILAIGAKAMGSTYGTGVRDLARVLRVPYTVNRKPGRIPTLCKVVENGGHRYSLDVIQEVADRLKPRPKKRTAPKTVAPQSKTPRTATAGGRGPMEILGDHACCGEILTHVGATYSEQYPGTCSYCGPGCQRWNRPGWTNGCSKDGVAVHKDGAAVTIRSDNFPGITASAVGHVLSSGQLFAALHHGGDESEASRDILRAAHGLDGATAAARALPAAVLDDVRQATERGSGVPLPQGNGTVAASSGPAVPRPRTYMHPAKRLRALVTKVAGASGDDAAGLLRWAARTGFAAGREAKVEPKAVAEAFRKAAVRAGLDNDQAMTVIRASYREATK